MRDRSSLGRHPRLRLFVLVSASLLAGCHSESPPLEQAVRTEHLSFRLLTFADGVVFSEALRDREVRLLFAGSDGQGTLETVLSYSVDSAARRRTAHEGSFDPRQCSFRFPASADEATEDLPEEIFLEECVWVEQTETLTIVPDKPSISSTSNPSVKAYNFVIILTDDQRFDTLSSMPSTMALAERGIVFENAYTTIPMCCPFRASLLAGGLYAHNTNVLTNQWPNGGAERFDDQQTVATELYGVGYRTGLFGKYMNGLANIAPRLPRGWTEFAANIPSSRFPERSWSDFYVFEGSRWPGHENLTPSSESDESGHFTHIEKYSPEYHAERAVSFLDRVENRPFFLYLALRAPHWPATPATEDESLFLDFQYQDRAYAELNLEDKPAWVRREAERFERWQQLRGDLPRKSLQSLQAVDRLVATIFRKLDEIGASDRTLVFLTSDSGMQWLEHRITNKAAPYEESLRVPFVAWFPEAEPRRDEHLIAANLDIPATIFDYLEIDARTDGLSLLAHDRPGRHQARESIFFEQYALYYHPSRHAQISEDFERYFAGLRVSRDAQDWKYVEHYSGEIELYDLQRDPFEEASLHASPSHRHLIAELANELRETKGLGITTRRLPAASRGKDYSWKLGVSGGRPPYSWRIIDSRVPGIRTRRHVGPPLSGLPHGLELDRTSGTIQGGPLRSGSWEFVVEVRDSSITHRTNGFQTYYQHLELEVLDSVP